jgi:hypothetical protein
MWQLILTSSLTVLGAVIVLVAGQALSKFVIEPIHKQVTLVGEICDAIVFYANVYANPSKAPLERKDEASKTFRKLASQLKAITTGIPLYNFWAKFKLVPSKSDASKAYSNLIGLSNGVYSEDGGLNHERAREIERLLRLDW